MSDKKYIGWTAKAVSTQYGEFINLSLKLSDMQAIVNGKGYVNMTVMKRKEVGQYGDTHYVVENDYKPKQQGISHSEAQGVFNGEVDVNSIPF